MKCKKTLLCLVSIFMLLFSGDYIKASNSNEDYFDCHEEFDQLTIAQFTLDQCTATSNGSYGDYSEFEGFVANKSECASMMVIGRSLYRNSPAINTHSCTPGINGSAAMCVSSEMGCNFQANHEKSIRFDLELRPGEGMAQLEKLTFYEKAPTRYIWIDGDHGENNYPTKYGVRVSVGGEEVLRLDNISTGNLWSLQDIDLSLYEGTKVDKPTIFSFELLAYCPINNGADVSVWDIDHVRVYAGCAREVNGGRLTLSNGDTSFDMCSGDESSDAFTPRLSLSQGPSDLWIITDRDGNILGLPAGPSFDLEEAGEGICLLWNLSYQNELIGVEVGNNVSSIDGCYDLSNPITVNRQGVNGGEIMMLDGATEVSLCLNDDISDIVEAIVTRRGGTSSSKTWLVTDTRGNIVTNGEGPPFSFSGSATGVSQIWHLSFREGLTGLSNGNNVSDLQGCFALSNPITVNHDMPIAGEIRFASGVSKAEVCAGASSITDFDVRVGGNSAQNSKWVATTPGRTVLAISESPDFNFADVEPGVYKVHHVAFSDGLVGLDIGLVLDRMIGCFAFSNGLDIEVMGFSSGSLTSGGGSTLSICAGDTDESIIDVSLTSGEISGTSGSWVITDDSNNILDLPASPPFDLTNAGDGICLIRYLNYNAIPGGLAVGSSLDAITGCYASTNAITVVRNQPQAGTISGGPFSFCVGDGQADNIAADGIALTGNSGANSQWVVTDSEGDILGLPGNFSDVNFDDAPAGVCLIWHLSFEDGLTGAAIGNNAMTDLDGCFDLSNSISVNRGSAQGGTLTGGPFEFCVGNGEADMIAANAITLNGNSGTNSQWVITSEAGEILGLPADYSDVNFDEAPAGVCFVWHLSFEDGLTGAEVGANAMTDLVGCFSLSNSISVNRTSLSGGNLSGGPYEFCAGDGEADNIAAGEVTVSGNSGSNSQWVITDPNGMILGLPGAPSDVNFDEAGAGTCLIWHLSFEDGLTGAAVGANASDLVGCFALSDSIVVTRTSGADCPGFCGAAGGSLTGGPYSFCAGDGEADNIAAGEVTVSGNSGSNSQWVITDANGMILGLPGAPSDVNFDEAGAGTCLIWHLSFEDGLTGAAVGANASDLVGCFALSDSIVVTRTSGADCPGFCGAAGGSLTGGPYSFCAGDGEADNIVAGEVTVSGNSGSNSQWVITDANGMILGLPGAPSDVNFDEAGAGTCLIWHLSFEDGLTGAAVGANASDLVGCFALSDSIVVTRTSGADCPGFCAAAGGSLTGGPYSFCAGDGEADNIAAGEVTVSGNSGSNSQWVITDPNGMILGLPGAPSDVNFDEAGAGTCLIWHLSFEDGLTGAAVGANASDLVGCFALSDSIVVTRTSGADCPGFCGAAGGSLTGGPYSFCAGDGEADNIAAGEVTVSGNSGSNSQWVITDANGMILGLPGAPSDVNFDEAGAGTCLIWHLSFEDGLTGAAVGANASDLVGCFALSDSIVVTRTSGADCPGFCAAAGGSLTGGPYSFCAGDGEADNIAAGEVTVSGNSGSNSQWVITDANGMILGLPGAPSDVNFDEAGAGTCLIWHLSFEDGLTGAAVGANAGDLVGCFALSDSIVVTRTSGADCPGFCAAAGGSLTGGPYSFCAGDGEADNIAAGEVTVSGNSGSNSQWVITDANGMILGLPGAPSDVNFDEAGAGTCLIWHLSFEDGLTGAAVGANAGDLVGCFALSDSIVVTRTSGADCPGFCGAAGGSLTGGPYSFCAGDGEPDNIVAGEVTVSGNSGTNSQWVITDPNGMILGLPGAPSDVNFDEAGAGTCLIWHLSFEDGLTGAAVGANASDLVGCFALSDSIVVTRTSGTDCPGFCDNDGGVLAGMTQTFCVGDGEDDFIPTDSITVSGNVGSNSQWVVTDFQGLILGLPDAPSEVNFEIAGSGVCFIRHMSFEDGLTGNTVGLNIDNLQGCFALSDTIIVQRFTGSDCIGFCSLDGGTITGGPFEFCVGDGEPDIIANESIVLAGNEGTNSQWIVTDGSGIILNLPASPSAIDFDAAITGTCFLWHLSYEDEITGAELGLNAANIQGCASLTNFIEITRVSEDDCSTGCAAVGGTLNGGPFEFCVGDGVLDSIPDSDIVLSDNVGSGTGWIVTDTFGVILGLPEQISSVNFDDAPAGVCLIWNISFDGEIPGLVIGNNALTDITGCFSLSDSIRVNRNSGVDCEQTACNAIGGTLAGGPFTFCVGDGTSDVIADSEISLADNLGVGSQLVVTNTAGLILNLPNNISELDFDGAGADTCLIWHLSFEEGLTGLTAGNNANTDLVGCFSLSNPLSVIRVSGADCEPGVAQPIINEIIPGNMVEIKNIGTASIDVSEYWLCDFPEYEKIGGLVLECGEDFVLEPGELITVITSTVTISNTDGEMGIYSSEVFGSSTAIVDYVEWGSSGHTRSSVAAGANIWTVGDMAPAFAADKSLSYDGEGDASTDWSESDPSLCAENTFVQLDDKELSAHIYPVPADSEISFELNKLVDNSVKTRVFDNYGQLVHSELFEANSTMRIDTKSLRGGVYYLHIQVGTGTTVQRFVVVDK